MCLTREQILAMTDLQREAVEIPEWGMTVYVQTMKAWQRDQFEVKHLENPKGNIRGRLAVATVCDEEGKPLFTIEDAEEMGEKSAAALDRIFNVAVRLNGLSNQDVETLSATSN